MFFGGLPEQDSLIAQLNGAPLDIQRRGRHMLASPLPALAGGENQLLLLYENGGRPNSGAGMEARCGPHDPSISEVGFLPSNPPTPLPLRWQISGDTTGLREKWFDPAYDDSAWQTAPIGTTPASAKPSVNLLWLRLHFHLPVREEHVWVPWKLHLDARGNGLIYLNGRLLGRWWEVGPQRDFYLPDCWLNFGPDSANVVTLCLRPTAAAAAIRNASVAPYADFAEFR
jgi:hypothetical protein